METIHLKTVDPISQELLRQATANGIRLNWERYEKLQPQDGFLRLGLSCPYGCLQGPCRIDPFGRGPDRGLCGLERDAMVAAMLLRICLHGTLTIINDAMAAGRTPAVSFAPGLKKSAVGAIKGVSIQSLSTAEVFKSAVLLQRPAADSRFLLEQTLVLALLSIGLLQATDNPERGKNRTIQAGYGVMSGNTVHIAIAGRPPVGLVDALVAAAARKSPAPVAVVSLGDWIYAEKGYLPVACSSAEAELLLSANTVSLLVAGPGADPGLMATARAMKVPVVAVENKTGAAEILRSARQFHSTAPRPEVTFEPHLKGAGIVAATLKEITGAAGNKAKTRLALLGGSDSLNFPLGYLPVELATSLRGAGCQVAAWGDAAVWMVKNGLTAAENADRVHLLDPFLGPLQAVEELARSAKPDRLSGICFTGTKDCRDLVVALGLALLGCNVAIADPIPFWGSSNVRDQLADLLAAGGGRLTGFDHPAEAQELLEWFAQ